VKIYGQSLREIFDKLPWTYKIVVTVSCFFILFVMIYAPSVLFSPIKKAKKDVVKLLKISGATKDVAGIFDPSISYDRKSGKVWMAYTVGEKSKNLNGGMLLHVRIASALAKNCEGWIQAKGGFEGKTDDILGADAQTVFRSGTWRVETPTLVHDPEDKGREWKLYAYKYFWDNDPTHALQLARRYGMIVYKYATDPAADNWSTEQWLFAPAYGHLPPPYGQMAMMHLNDLNESLKNVEVYSRPSVIVRDGMLVMTLSAFTEGTSPDRIIMIVSGDHGKSWKYMGTPLRVLDLKGIEPYTRLSGASLIEQDGIVYLAVVLGNAQQHGQGTFIFSFDDFTKGHLKRDPKTGVPIVLRHVPLYKPESFPIGGGFATYSDVCPFGLLTSEQVPGTEKFRLLKTYEKPVL